ncbi:MAG TPA: hypothetical protein VF486_06170 [Actinomycetes bacterium]
MVVGAASLLVRFRRARGIERQQLRWVALAAAVVALLVGAVGAGEATGATLPDPAVAGVLSLAVLEVGIGAAVLRYRLYDLIQAFAARLRQQVDLDSLTAELLAVVDQTVQPTRASLWLRPAGDAAVPKGSFRSLGEDGMIPGHA